jgi:hypothetical protein
MLYKVVLFTIISIFFVSCTKKVEQSKSSVILIKTEKFKFYDTGFINKNSDFLEVEMFSTAKNIFNLKIEDKICINNICYDKKVFNNDFLSSYYEDDLLENIFRKKSIFNKMKYEETLNGFSQQISNKNIDIFYKIEKDSIYFKDRKNRIIIKVNEIK